MTNHDCARVISGEACRIIGIKHFQITQCTEKSCQVCLDDRDDIARQTEIIKKCRAVESGPISGSGDDVCEVFLNHSDAMVEWAVKQLGDDFSPH